jgi:predicted MFS family arabinose efflux permease
VSVSAAAPARWPAVVALGLSAFAIVAAEFLPVGVLPAIARDADVSLGLTSAVVLIPGLVAGVSAPLVIVGARRVDRRSLVLGLMALLLVSDAISWLTHDFGAFLFARVLLGLVLGGFWAVGPSFGARLAPQRAAVATSIVLAGISAGTVLGLPVGTLIEASVGWRWSFAADGALAVLVLTLLALVVPRASGAKAVTFADIGAVVADPTTRVVLILSALALTAQLTASTFIGALLEDLPGFTSTGVTIVLLVYGGVGLLSNLAAPRLDRSMPQLFAWISAGLTIAFALIACGTGTAWSVVVLATVWGSLWGAVPFVMQTWTITSVPDAPEAGSAALVTVFQISIAAGSAVSGVLLTLGGLSLVFAGAAALYAAGFVLVTAVLRAARAQRSATGPTPAAGEVA